ncbi:MAG: damage-inducible protein DinB, partial [Sphingobacteriales bacterium]
HFHNQKFAHTFATGYESLSVKTTKLYSHIVNAHHIWTSRIESTNVSFGVWDIHSLEDYKRIDKMNYERTLVILNSYELNSTTQYSTTKGQGFNNTVQDILFHIVNHSTYHRGQIAMDLRLNGLEPIATDYIFYKR